MVGCLVAIENHKMSAKFDCRDVYINANGETIPLFEKALYVLEDMETVYINTGILLETLPDNMQLSIIQMYYIEDEEGLYNFLETYSS